VLQPAFDVIDGNVNADSVDQTTLKAALQDAADLGLLTPEQALTMLELLQWSALTDPDALANAAATLETVLADLVAGTITDPVAALTNLLNQLATPPGTLNVIGRAGASDDILNQVSSLVAGGVPPGIVVRITKQGLRDGLSMDEISLQLDVLAAALADGDEIAWGQIANNAADAEPNTYQNQELNKNTGGSDEPEQEVNAQGNGHTKSESTPANNDEKKGNGKKDNNPGKGNKK
jgi:hypothetical protein